jgi:hypothetical protein
MRTALPTAVEPRQQTGSKRLKSAGLTHAEAGDGKPAEPHEESDCASIVVKRGDRLKRPVMPEVAGSTPPGPVTAYRCGFGVAGRACGIDPLVDFGNPGKQVRAVDLPARKEKARPANRGMIGAIDTSRTRNGHNSRADHPRHLGGSGGTAHRRDHTCRRRSRSLAHLLPRRARPRDDWRRRDRVRRRGDQRSRRDRDFPAQNRPRARALSAQRTRRTPTFPSDHRRRASSALDNSSRAEPRSMRCWPKPNKPARRSRGDLTIVRGIYSGYFRDPDGHLWEIIWNPPTENATQ